MAKGFGNRNRAEKMAKLKRADALDRPEIRGPSTPRRPAAGVTSAALKVEDPAVRQIIDEALSRKRGSA